MRTPLIALAAVILLAAAPVRTNSAGAATTVGAPSSVELTVYNQGFALVREQRTLDLSSTMSEVVLDSVPGTIEATSVRLTPLGTAALTVREQNYQTNLAAPSVVLGKAVGQRVRVRRWHGDREEVLEGTLLSAPTGGQYYGYGNQPQPGAGAVLLTNDGARVFTDGDIELAELPTGLQAKPRLTWLVESEKAGRYPCELSYLAQQLSWMADYVGIVQQDGDTIDLTGWVTLNNFSGSAFRDAALQLMAGDVHRAPQPQSYMATDGTLGARAAGAGGMAPQFQEESFFEYHLYTLGRPVTIGERETKQLTLIEADQVKVRKAFVFDPWRGAYYRWQQSGGQWDPRGTDMGGNKKVGVMIEVTNDQAHGLGLPLPAGRFKLYQRDPRGRMQFLGEDQIDHTPKDEKFRLWVGDAFDIVAERKSVNMRHFVNGYEEDVEVSLRNHRKDAATIEYFDRYYCNWDIKPSSHPFEKVSSHVVRYEVKVPANGEVKVTYTVRVTCP